MRGGCKRRSTPDLASDGCARIDRNELHPVPRCERLDQGELADPSPAGWITNYRHPRCTRGNLLEQFQPFSGETVLELREARDIGAGTRHAFHEARPDRIDGL